MVLFEDETLLREFPPLRACWAKRGTPAVVPITGSNARRTVFATLNPATGERLLAVRLRNRAEDFRAFLTQVRAQYKRWDILLLLDQGSSHTAAATQRRAAALRIGFGWLPIACPELNPTELLWRDGKQRISANRTYESVDEQALLFTDYLRSLSPAEALTLSGVRSGNFWLPT